LTLSIKQLPCQFQKVSSENPWERGRLARIFLKNAGMMPALPAKKRGFRSLPEIFQYPYKYAVIRASGAAVDGETGKLCRTIPAKPADTHWKELPTVRS